MTPITRFFLLSAGAHGVLGAVLFTISLPTETPRLPQAIQVTLVQPQGMLDSAAAIQKWPYGHESFLQASSRTAMKRVDARPSLSKTGEIPTVPVSLTPPLSQEPPIVPVTESSHTSAPGGELPLPVTPFQGQSIAEAVTGNVGSYQIGHGFSLIGDAGSYQISYGSSQTGQIGYGSSQIDGQLKTFLEEVRSRLDRAKRYPWLARLRGLEGTTQLRFRILPSGEPAEIRVVQSSQSELLDEEAIATVRRAARFPYPPVGLGQGILIRLPMVFQLTGG